MSIKKTVKRDEFGVVVYDGIPVVSSSVVADRFDKEHKHVLDTIRTAIKTMLESDNILTAEFSAMNFIESERKVRGKLYPEYLLTKDGFTYLALGFTGAKATDFKIEYINRFNKMEDFIRDRQIAKLEYPELTGMIKISNENPQFYHYSNEADMINQIVLGLKSKQFKVKYNIPDGNAIRDYMLPWQIEAIQKLQKVDVGLVAAIPVLEGRKSILSKYFKSVYGSMENLPKLLNS